MLFSLVPGSCCICINKEVRIEYFYKKKLERSINEMFTKMTCPQIMRLIFLVILAQNSTNSGRSLGKPVSAKICGLLILIYMTWLYRETSKQLMFQPEVLYMLSDKRQFLSVMKGASVYVCLSRGAPVYVWKQVFGSRKIFWPKMAY